MEQLDKQDTREKFLTFVQIISHVASENISRDKIETNYCMSTLFPAKLQRLDKTIIEKSEEPNCYLHMYDIHV